MSTLDRVIASLLRNVDDVQRSMAITEALKAKAEEAQADFEAVGMEGKAAEAAATVDWLEGIYADCQQALSQIESQIPFAESLKTAGGGANPAGSSNGSDSKPEPVATTGADPKPNPVHATPAHSREPSRKVGDPIRPVEMEPDRDVRMSAARRFGRRMIRGADDVRETSQEVTSPIGNILENDFDPHNYEQARPTTVVPDPTVSSVAPVRADVDASDVAGTIVMGTAVVFEAMSRFINKRGK